MPIAGTTITTEGIAALLRTTRSKVPEHQRSYEWGIPEIQEFLEDIRSSMEGTGQDFFLGSVVSTAPGKDGRIAVLDGQQRIATAAILLCGIADALNGLGDTERSNAVRSQYIAKLDIKSGELLPQLSLNYEDDPYFQKLCEKGFGKPAKGSPDSHARLFEARATTDKWIALQLGSIIKTDQRNWLVRLLEFLADRAYVIHFKVPDDANAFLIFETLNERGIELSIADLLKNYLLGHSKDQSTSVLAAWVRMLATLRANGGENQMTDFLRHYWSSKYEVVREKLLYKKIKERIATPRNVADFVADLEKNAIFYAAMLSPEHEYWGEFDEQAKENLRVLTTLGFEQYRPLLLATMAHMTQREVGLLLASLVNWNVRLIVVGGGGGGVMEARYAELGRDVRSGSLKSASDISKKAKPHLPNDLDFEDKFGSATISKVALARYYLRTLESAKTGKSEEELVPNKDPSKLTLEHVLPEAPGSNWPDFAPELHKAYYKRLGNLCLLTHKRNSDLKSGAFTAKKKIYAKSTLELTSEIAKYRKWVAASIDKRQTELAALAVKTWKL